MALETLKGVKEIGGFSVIDLDDLEATYPDKIKGDQLLDEEWFEREIKAKNFIYTLPKENSLLFTIQDGPIKEVGVNGCQVDTMIYAAMEILSGLNAKFPCEYNQRAISSLSDAIKHLADRKADREARQVEGLSKV